MKLQDQFKEFGVTKERFNKLSKHQKNIFKNSWRALKAKNAFNKKQRKEDLKELVTIFYDDDWNVIYNEQELLKDTKFAKKD